MRKKYKMVHGIGSGGYGVVNKCVDTETNRVVAVKKIDFGDGLEGVSSVIIREVSLLKELDHENIVRLLDVRTDENNAELVFEYMDIDLLEFMRTRKENVFNAGLIKKFLHQIICGISYCHSHKILHRDMKPSNLLIDIGKEIVKIADFGLARVVGVPLNTQTEEVATLAYRAPEILLGCTKYSAAVDVWAVGCIFAEMVTREPLFKGMCDADILFEIFSFFGVPTEDTWPGVTSLSEFISRISMFPPEQRRNLAEVVTGLEPDGFDLLSKMLCLNPTTRITAYSALKHPYFNDIRNAA